MAREPVGLAVLSAVAGAAAFARLHSPCKSVARIYAIFLSTSAEFFDPNAMQLQMAYSIAFLRPISGT